MDKVSDNLDKGEALLIKYLLPLMLRKLFLKYTWLASPFFNPIVTFILKKFIVTGLDKTVIELYQKLIDVRKEKHDEQSKKATNELLDGILNEVDDEELKRLEIEFNKAIDNAIDFGT